MSQRAERPPRVPALDGVRALSVLGILWLHLPKGDFFGNATLDRYFAKGSVFGQVGVDAFFVLSGFLISRLLLSDRGHEGYYKHFYVRRSLRILPLYYLTLLVYFFAWPWLAGEALVPLGKQAWYWLYANNIAYTFDVDAPGPNHFWSLAVEEHFYLVWPFVVAALGLRQLERASIALIVLSIASRAALLSLGYGVFYFTLCRVDALAAGCLLAIWEKRGVLPSYRRALGVAAAVAAPLLLLTWTIANGQHLAVVQVVKFTIVSTFFAAAVGLLITADPTRGIARAMASPSLAFVASISYGLYVLHPFVYEFLEHHRLVESRSGTAMLEVTLSVVAAYLSCRLFEQPVLRLSGSNSKVAPEPPHTPPETRVSEG